jgi:hypothetical protein
MLLAGVSRQRSDCARVLRRPFPVHWSAAPARSARPARPWPPSGNQIHGLSVHQGSAWPTRARVGAATRTAARDCTLEVWRRETVCRYVASVQRGNPWRCRTSPPSVGFRAAATEVRRSTRLCLDKGWREATGRGPCALRPTSGGRGPRRDDGHRLIDAPGRGVFDAAERNRVPVRGVTKPPASLAEVTWLEGGRAALRWRQCYKPSGPESGIASPPLCLAL